MSKPEIAVLLATYNGEVYLEEQLKSIQHQSDVNISIIVSDDSSFDSTLQILNTILTARSDLVLLPNQELGSASANFFRLLREADLSGVDYVALSDQDDIWLGDKLSRAVEMINKNNVDAYSSNVTAFWENGREKIINKAQPQQQWDYMFESAGPGCTFVLTKSLALELQQFLINNKTECQNIGMHDWFIYAFARSRGFNWFIDHQAHMLYRQHTGNVMGANIGIKATLARWKKLREGWLVDQSLLFAIVLGYSNMWPIKRLNRYNFFDRLFLIININKLRRRLRDRCALVFFLLMPLANQDSNVI